MCDLPSVAVELASLGEAFGYGFIATAAVMLTAIPVRLLLRAFFHGYV